VKKKGGKRRERGSDRGENLTKKMEGSPAANDMGSGHIVCNKEKKKTTVVFTSPESLERLTARL